MAHEKVANLLCDLITKQINLCMQVQKNSPKMGIQLKIGCEIRTITIKESSTDILDKKKRTNYSRCIRIDIDSTKEDKEKHFQHEHGK